MLLSRTCARFYKSVHYYDPIKFNNCYLSFHFTEIDQRFKCGKGNILVHQVLIGKVVPKTSTSYSSELSEKRRQLLKVVECVWSGVLRTTWLYMLGRCTAWSLHVLVLPSSLKTRNACVAHFNS